MNAISRIKQFVEKNHSKVCHAYQTLFTVATCLSNQVKLTNIIYNAKQQVSTWIMPVLSVTRNDDDGIMNDYDDSNNKNSNIQLSIEP